MKATTRNTLLLIAAIALALLTIPIGFWLYIVYETSGMLDE